MHIFSFSFLQDDINSLVSESTQRCWQVASYEIYSIYITNLDDFNFYQHHCCGDATSICFYADDHYRYLFQDSVKHKHVKYFDTKHI